MTAAWPLSSVIPPGGSSVLWGRTEYGVSVDATTAGVNSLVLIHDGEQLDVAFVPQASFLPGNGAGDRLGATPFPDSTADATVRVSCPTST